LPLLGNVPGHEHVQLNSGKVVFKKPKLFSAEAEMRHKDLKEVRLLQNFLFSVHVTLFRTLYFEIHLEGIFVSHLESN
jgi:hypothetical protein